MPKAAIIAFHGMGQQQEFEFLGQVARAVSGSTAPEDTPIETQRLGNRLIPFATVSSPDDPNLTIDLFEAYWSPWTKGKVTLFDILYFLLSAGWRGISAYLFRKRQFSRILFGRVARFQLAATTPLILGGLSLSILSIFLLVLLFFWVGIGYGFLMLGGSGLRQCLLHEIRIWLELFLIFILALGALFGILAALPFRRGKGPILYSLVVLALLACISTSVATCLTVQSFWRVRKDTDPGPVHKCKPLVDPRLQALYINQPGLFGIVAPSLSNPSFNSAFISALTLLVVVGFVLGARVLTSFLGDLVAYLSAFRANEFYGLRETIRTLCFDLAQSILSREDGHNQPHYDTIVFLGHSLGSVIAFDTLNRVLLESPRNAQRIGGLITLGSPLDKASFLFRSFSGQKDDLRNRLDAELRPLLSNRELREQLPWINFHTWLDPVSASLDYFSHPSEAHWTGNVQNIQDTCATVPLLAHVTYWQNPLIGQALRYLCSRRTNFSVHSPQNSPNC